MTSDIEQQFNSEIEYRIACEKLDTCLNAGDELTRLIDNVCQLQLVANKYPSREALSVISDLATGELASYSTEGFFATAWDKIKKFFKWLWEKISAFFKWIWNKLKSLFTSNKKVTVTPDSPLAKLAEQNSGVAKYIEVRKTSSEAIEPMAQMGLIIGAVTLGGLTLTAIAGIIKAAEQSIDKRTELLDKPVALATVITGDKFKQIESVEADFDTAMKVSSDKPQDVKANAFINKLDAYEKSLMVDAKRKVYFTAYKFGNYTGDLITHADKLKRIDDKVQKTLREVSDSINKLANQNNYDPEAAKGYLKVAKIKARMANQFAKVIATLNKRYVAACRVAQHAFPQFFTAERVKEMIARNDPPKPHPEPVYG